MTIKQSVVAAAVVVFGAAAVTGCNAAEDAVNDAKDIAGSAVAGDTESAAADAHRFGWGAARERRQEARREHRVEERRERRQEARREHRAEERREHRRVEHEPWWRRFHGWW